MASESMIKSGQMTGSAPSPRHRRAPTRPAPGHKAVLFRGKGSRAAIPWAGIALRIVEGVAVDGRPAHDRFHTAAPDPSGRLRPDGGVASGIRRGVRADPAPITGEIHGVHGWTATLSGVLRVALRRSASPSTDAHGKYGNGRGGSSGGFLGAPTFPRVGPGHRLRCQRRRLGQADGGVGCQAYVPAPPVGYDPGCQDLRRLRCPR